MGRTKIDYSAAEREYRTGSDSIRSLATRYGVSFSSMAEWARNHEWDKKRNDYRAHISDTAIEKTADKHIREKEEVLDEAFSLLRATLYQYGAQLKAGMIPVNVKDLVMAVQALQSLLGQPTTRTEATILGVSITADSRDLDLGLLRELERVARTRLVGGSVEGTPQLRLAGPRPN
jgi:transposase-like protein